VYLSQIYSLSVPIKVKKNIQGGENNRYKKGENEENEEK
jgi:hypothetical protein